MKVKPNKDDPYSWYLKIIFGDNFVIRLRSGLIVVGGRKILGIFVTYKFHMCQEIQSCINKSAVTNQEIPLSSNWD